MTDESQYGVSMEPLGQGFALVFAGISLGWTAYFSFVVAPQAFRDLDQGRANRFVRNAMKNGHPPAAGLALIAAAAAVAGSAVAGAAMMGVAATLFVLARWALAPRDDGPPPPGARRKRSTARVVAAALTAMIMVVILAAIILIGLKI
jgi:hypothetical protein